MRGRGRTYSNSRFPIVKFLPDDVMAICFAQSFHPIQLMNELTIEFQINTVFDGI